MTTYTIPLAPDGTRSRTGAELETLSFQLGASGQRHLKIDPVAVVRLGERGRLALVQVADWHLGRTLVNLYDIDYDPLQDFHLRWSLQGLSQWRALADAIGGQSYSALLPANSLADVHNRCTECCT